MNSKNLYKILSSKEHNTHYLNRYLNFVNACNENNFNLETFEKHHICPSSKNLWPEYKSKYKNSWNIVNLTPRQHYIAHWILARCFGGGMWFAFNMMCNGQRKERKYRVSSRAYQELRKNLSELLSGRVVSEKTRKMMSEAKKGKPLSDQHKYRLSLDVKNKLWIYKNNESKRVNKNEIGVYLNSGWLVGRVDFTDEAKENMSKSTKGVSKPTRSEEHKQNIGKTVKNKVAVRDTESNTNIVFRCSVDDPHYLSGRYVFQGIGRVVSEEDKERRRNLVMVRDTESDSTESFTCDKNDPHWISGRYVGHTKGIKVKCPHCEKEGGKGVMTRWHFENCKQKIS
jgi:hypothetical protein